MLPAALAAAVSGCGDDRAYRNEPRPPVPITVTAYISPDRVSISPARIGGGPITVIATNQTGRSQALTLETTDASSADRPGLRQRTGPINPGDTAAINATVGEGSYAVRVASEAIAPAKLAVRGQRPSAQQTLLLP